MSSLTINILTGFTEASRRAVRRVPVRGGPPGPIASPGLASIEAALSPAKTNYLYFVTVNLDSGKTKYAKTYPGHQKNVRELRKWMDAHPS